jgi:hypothetical protein
MKNSTSRPKTGLVTFLLMSVVAHLIAIHMLARTGRYDFTRPVTIGRILPVEIKTLPNTTDGREEMRSVPLQRPPPALPPAAGKKIAKKPLGNLSSDSLGDAGLSQPGTFASSAKGPETVAGKAQDGPPLPEAGQIGAPETVVVPGVTDRPTSTFERRKVEEFLTAKREKLSYLISLYGLPVGSATLEARNEGGELRITSSVRSNDVISALYPVDNRAETRLMAGSYILTRIRQQEGTHRSDVGFTICFPQRNVFWINRLSNRVANYAFENDDVLDVVTGFYSLRMRHLEVGRTEVLHLFDSNAFAATPVHILRRERIFLPSLEEVDTLVIQPELQTEGLFRRTGDLLIWLTDDEFKVPVRLETTILLGKVKAELISAEAER